MREIIKARFMGETRDTITYFAETGTHIVMLTYDGSMYRLIKRPYSTMEEKTICETTSLTSALTDYLVLVASLSLKFRDEIRGPSKRRRIE